jgi:hypothetical protein
VGHDLSGNGHVLSNYIGEDKHATTSSPSGFSKMKNDPAQNNPKNVSARWKIAPPDRH